MFQELVIPLLIRFFGKKDITSLSIVPNLAEKILVSVRRKETQLCLKS